MKIILTSDVSGLGASGDSVEVRDGYARNYLLPQGMAIVATKGAQKQVESIRRSQENRRVRDLEHARELQEQLQNMGMVQLSKKVSKKGKLFGSISESDVTSAVRQAGGPSLDKRSIELKGNVKSLGKMAVGVRLHPDVYASMYVEVNPGG